MSNSKGTAAKGTKLGYADTAAAASPTYIGDVFDIKPGGVEVETDDITHHESTQAETVGTLEKAKTIEFKCNTVHGASPENRAALWALVNVNKYWTVYFPNGAKGEVYGFLSDLDFDSHTPRAKQSFSGTITVARGKMTFTEAA